MALAYVLVTFITLLCAITNVTIDFGLLYYVFIAKKLKKSTSLTLFYVRFAVDGVVGLQSIFVMLITITKQFNLLTIDHAYQIFVFAVSWLTVNLASTRVFLVIVITFDRTLAVFTPIIYHNYRSKISNIWLISVIFCYPIMDNMVLWVFCKYDLNIPPGCVTFGCIASKCYLGFSLIHEVAAHSVITAASLALAVKLFLWNHFKNKTRSKDLERANHLALIDAAVIFVFDVLPILCLMAFEQVEEVGTVMAFTKASGYTLEGILVYRALKRKNETSVIRFMKIKDKYEYIEISNMLNFQKLTYCYQVFAFLVDWTAVNMNSSRVLLFAIILLDRTFAVFLPITYHNYRKKLSNIVLIWFVLGYPLIDNTILWGFCQYELKFPSGCIEFGCLVNRCYRHFHFTREMVTHSITITISMVLAVKLFVENNCSNQYRSKSLERANYLVLIDAAVILIFGILPMIILVLFNLVEDLGAILSLTKSAGYSVEWILVYQALKRKK